MKDRKNTIIKPVVFNTEKHKNLLEFIENEGDFSKIVRELLIFAQNSIKHKNVKLLDTLKEIYSANKESEICNEIIVNKNFIETSNNDK